jgi:hypothetical protein
MGMKWIKQIFGIKPDDEWHVPNDIRFTDATPTKELVITGSIQNSSEHKTYTKNTLSKKTKVQLEELAKSEFGLELDRRKKKEELIIEIIDAQ